MPTIEALLPPTSAAARPVRVQQQPGRPRRPSLPRSVTAALVAGLLAGYGIAIPVGAVAT